VINRSCCKSCCWMGRSDHVGDFQCFLGDCGEVRCINELHVSRAKYKLLGAQEHCHGRSAKPVGVAVGAKYCLDTPSKGGIKAS
jgi:hypothetical protein